MLEPVSPDCPEDGYSGRLEASASSGEMNENNRDGPPWAGQNTTRGMDEREARDVGQCLAGVEPTVSTAAIIARFKDDTRLALKPSTQAMYAAQFGRLAKAIKLDGKTLAQLRAAKMKGEILGAFEALNVKPASRRIMNAAWKTVWTRGLRLPWPIEARYDLGKPQKVAARETPPDAQVAPWAAWIAGEKDAYRRTLAGLFLHLGLRPSHAARLKWRNIRCDPATGKPYAIVADGSQEGFKTAAPVWAWLPPELAKAIEELRVSLPSSRPEQPLLPIRGNGGCFAEPLKAQASEAVRDRLGVIQRQEGLPVLTPVAFRHWIASAARREGLPEVARARMQGHDPAAGTGMGGHYDNPQPEDILALQRDTLRGSLLARVRAPTVELSAAPSAELAALYESLKAGKLGAFELASKVDAMARQERAAATPPL